MTRRLLLVALTLAAASSTAAAAPPLHLGVHGKRVAKAQWLMQGHNRIYPRRLRTYTGPIDGRYGRRTAKAVRRTKYLLGYPIQALDGVYGWRLHALLTGKRKLSTLSKQRRARRLHLLAHPHLGVVAQTSACSGFYSPYPFVLDFARIVSARYGRPLVCSSGYRPGSIVHGTGRRSMHATREAADLATPTYAMNTDVGHAALEAAGMSRARAASYASFAGWVGGVNILFHTYIGGNHYSHVHVGLHSWPTSGLRTLAAVAAQPVGLNTEEPGAWNIVYRRGLTGAAGTSLGYAIPAMKRELAYNGFAGSMDTSTRLFGIYAERETRAFQAANGLAVDGVIGPRTALVLLRKRATLVEAGMPDHQLARQKTWESANDPNAIGPDGHDHGLLQIRLTSHPEVTLAQAVDPAFSLPWAADRQRQNYSTLHDWDGVLCAWNAGYSLAQKWVAAGKPPAGGPVNANGVDLYAACTSYVRHVRASAF